MPIFASTKISSLLLLLISSMFASFSEAREHVISAWKIPSSDSESLNNWAEKSRFLIGDSLAWKYDGSKDSVLEVSRKDYINCNTSSPTGIYAGDDTTVELERSGPFYFISGAEGHCQKGQKLIVVVMSEKHRRRVLSPAPSPEEVEGTAVAPAPASGAGIMSGGYLMLVLGALVVGM